MEMTILSNFCRSEAQIQEYFLPKSQREQAKRRRRGGGGSGGQQQPKREAAELGAAPEEAVALNSISEWWHYIIIILSTYWYGNPEDGFNPLFLGRFHIGAIARRLPRLPSYPIAALLTSCINFGKVIYFTKEHATRIDAICTCLFYTGGSYTNGVAEIKLIFFEFRWTYLYLSC